MRAACSECGFDPGSVTPDNAAAEVRRLGVRYSRPLTRLLPGESPEVLSRRPDAATWSAVEYAAHVRDVVRFWSWALHRAVTEEHPLLPRPDPDAAAADGGYGTQPPKTVADDLGTNAGRMADKVEGLSADEWARTASFDGDDVDALFIARKVVHEGHHHLLDVGRVLRAVRAS